MPNAADVLPRALEIADEVVKNTSTVSSYLMRDLMWQGPSSVEAAHLLESKLLYELFDSTDKKEGVRAFLEKRPAKFTGTMGADAPATWPWYDSVDVGIRAKASTIGSKSKL